MRSSDDDMLLHKASNDFGKINRKEVLTVGIKVEIQDSLTSQYTKVGHIKQDFET